MSPQPTYRDAAKSILTGIGADPASLPARRALGAVFIVEGRNRYWNPMNWTLPSHYPILPGNSEGVRMYPDFETGMGETANELRLNPRWSDFVASLHSPRNRYVALVQATRVYAEWEKTPPDFAQFSTSEIVARLNEEMPS